MTTMFIAHPLQGPLYEGGRLRGGVRSGRNLAQKLGHNPLARGLDRADQQPIVTQIEYVERPAALQSLAATPVERENRLALLGQCHRGWFHGNNLLPKNRRRQGSVFQLGLIINDWEIALAFVGQ
jgi:hypothetical protein